MIEYAVAGRELDPEFLFLLCHLVVLFPVGEC
jgi:hypothetical protein